MFKSIPVLKHTKTYLALGKLKYVFLHQKFKYQEESIVYIYEIHGGKKTTIHIHNEPSFSHVQRVVVS